MARRLAGPALIAAVLAVLCALFVASFSLWQRQQREVASPPAPDSSAGGVAVSGGDPLTAIEDTVVRYLRSGPGERRAQRVQLKEALALLQRARTNPTQLHWKYYKRWIRRELGQPVTPLIGWDVGINEYIFEHLDPASVLRDMQASRLRSKPLSEAVTQIAHGHFDAARGSAILSVLKPHLALSALSGRTVADIGSGPGQLTAFLVDLVGTHGKAIAVDVDRSVQELARVMQKTDPRFKKIDFRIVEANDAAQKTGLARGEVDLALLIDVHILGPVNTINWSGADSSKDQLAWARDLRRSLKPGGKFIILETTSGQKDRQQEPQEIARLLKLAGMSSVTHWNPANYVIVARPTAP